MAEIETAPAGIILRLDDRRVHGQILYGWALQWPLEVAYIVSDALAVESEEKEIYREQIGQLPEGQIVSVKEALGILPFLPQQQNILVIADDWNAFFALTELRNRFSEIHVANSGHVPEAIQLFDSVFIPEQQLGKLLMLSKMGIRLIYRALPTDFPQTLSVHLEDIIRGDSEQKGK